jgi:hypothetical protein
MVYDNGVYASESRWVELGIAQGKLRQGAPVAQSPGQRIGRRHYSWVIGYAERLPNGNTMVCDGSNGRFFQQTPDGSIVWEYINPYIGLPILQGAVFRALSYAPNYCPQFKTLKPVGGTALTPASTVHSDETNNEEQENPAARIIVPVMSALIAFLAGWLLARRR